MKRFLSYLLLTLSVLNCHHLSAAGAGPQNVHSILGEITKTFAAHIGRPTSEYWYDAFDGNYTDNGAEQDYQKLLDLREDIIQLNPQTEGFIGVLFDEYEKLGNIHMPLKGDRLTNFLVEKHQFVDNVNRAASLLFQPDELSLRDKKNAQTYIDSATKHYHAMTGEDDSATVAYLQALIDETAGEQEAGDQQASQQARIEEIVNEFWQAADIANLQEMEDIYFNAIPEINKLTLVPAQDRQAALRSMEVELERARGPIPTAQRAAAPARPASPRRAAPKRPTPAAGAGAGAQPQRPALRAAPKQSAGPGSRDEGPSELERAWELRKKRGASTLGARGAFADQPGKATRALDEVTELLAEVGKAAGADYADLKKAVKNYLAVINKRYKEISKSDLLKHTQDFDTIYFALPPETEDKLNKELQEFRAFWKLHEQANQ